MSANMDAWKDTAIQGTSNFMGKQLTGGEQWTFNSTTCMGSSLTQSVTIDNNGGMANAPGSNTVSIISGMDCVFTMFSTPDGGITINSGSGTNMFNFTAADGSGGQRILFTIQC